MIEQKSPHLINSIKDISKLTEEAQLQLIEKGISITEHEYPFYMRKWINMINGEVQFFFYSKKRELLQTTQTKMCLDPVIVTIISTYGGPIGEICVTSDTTFIELYRDVKISLPFFDQSIYSLSFTGIFNHYSCDLYLCNQNNTVWEAAGRFKTMVISPSVTNKRSIPKSNLILTSLDDINELPQETHSDFHEKGFNKLFEQFPFVLVYIWKNETCSRDYYYFYDNKAEYIDYIVIPWGDIFMQLSSDIFTS